jgi:hypothetical protein
MFCHSFKPRLYQGPAFGALQSPNLIGRDENESIANVFCFGVFADKNNGVVYNDLTHSFPFISLDGSICFLYCTIIKQMQFWPRLLLALMTSAFSTHTFKPKINIMDNQVTKHIKQCKLQLVEPHNHRMNAAERAIQTFKDAFIAALATTDSKFPLQL